MLHCWLLEVSSLPVWYTASARAAHCKYLLLETIALAYRKLLHITPSVYRVCRVQYVQVRVIFLSQLLHEGRSHLQQHLTASVLGRKVFVMPFHRGIQVTPQALGAMKAALMYCQQVRLQPARMHMCAA